MKRKQVKTSPVSLQLNQIKTKLPITIMPKVTNTISAPARRGNITNTSTPATPSLKVRYLQHDPEPKKQEPAAPRGRPVIDFQFPKGRFTADELADKKHISKPYAYALVRKYLNSKLRVVELVKANRHVRGRATQVYSLIRNAKKGKEAMAQA